MRRIRTHRFRRRTSAGPDRAMGKLEEYIEVIHDIQTETGEDHAHTNEIASRLGLKAASVTEMLSKLERKGLVRYKAYYGAGLTEKGIRMARELGHRHGTIARFLEIIGVPRDEAQRDACQLEHHITGTTVDRMVSFLDFLDGTGQGKGVLKRFKAWKARRKGHRTVG